MLFLRNHATDVRQTVATGNGVLLQELAAEMKVSRTDVGRFGRLLRADRAQLLDLADSARLTPARAVQFFQQVRKLADASHARG